MWFLRFDQLFESEKTSAKRSKVCFSFFVKQLQVFDSLQDKARVLIQVEMSLFLMIYLYTEALWKADIIAKSECKLFNS